MQFIEDSALVSTCQSVQGKTFLKVRTVASGKTLFVSKTKYC